MRLNIYDKKNCVKTYTADTYDLMFGTLEDIAEAVNLDGLKEGTDAEIIKMAAQLAINCKDTVSDLMKDIFDGKRPPLPTGTDAMYALTAAMTAYAREHKNEMARIANSIAYADRMPPDFSTILMKDYMAIEKGYKEKLMRVPEFYKWLQTKGKLLNGAV